jgi:hypothetical protein
MKPIPDFKSIEERDTWFRDNADYFTVVRHNGHGNYTKIECNSLKEALYTAKWLATKHDNTWMIYAVVGVSDAFVRMITPDWKDHEKKEKATPTSTRPA